MSHVQQAGFKKYNYFPTESSNIVNRLKLHSPFIDECLNKMVNLAQHSKNLSDYHFSFQVMTTYPITLNAKAQKGITKTTVENTSIGSLLLIDPETFPSKFLVNDFDDIRMKDPTFLNELIIWLNQNYFQIGDLDPCQVGEQERNELKIFLVLISNPEKFKKTTEHTIAHELAHHFYKHYEKEPFKILKSSEEADLNKELLSYSLGSAALCGILGSFMSSSIGIQILCGVMGGIAGLFLPFINLINHDAKCREQEKEADLLGAKALQDASGLIYECEVRERYFQHCLQQFNLEEQKMILKKRERYALNEIHPSNSTRIKYLTEFQNSISK